MKLSTQAPEGMQFTGRMGGGLGQDLKRRWPHFAADFREGLHAKIAASAFFLFFACLANAIAFGALTGAMTGGQIGIVEMLIMTAAGGVAYALFSGQPLTLLGGTGPIVVFTALLYQTCQQMHLPFLPVYAWVGIWSGVFLILCALFDLSFLMRYFTRFTDEIFSALIALIFIYEALNHLLGPLIQQRPVSNAAFLALIVGLGTYQIARNLKGFGRTPYLRFKVRIFLADFGPAIAISLMTIGTLLFPGIHLEAPVVPEHIVPTISRTWLIGLGEVPNWVPFAAILPALLATILLFLDQNITTRLVNAPHNRLKKGSGYHLDLGVVGILTLAGSLFGLPWVVAATVHSLNHVRSLAETQIDPSSHTETIVSVRENRVSALLVHLLIGGSLLLLNWIAHIPLPVLYGLFLFMGLATLHGNQFFDRMKLWVMDPALYPKAHYIRKVAARKMHAYTFIQSVCLGILWLLKVSPLGLLFPVFIAALVPIRQALGRFFSASDLKALDAEEIDSEDELV